MARGATNQANNTYGEATGIFQGANSRANQLYGQLVPILSNEATNPQGYGAKDLAAMNTASQQSVGGSTAGAVGEGNLAAARTRNAGGFAPALDEAVRQGGRQLATNALNTQIQNANVKQAQQQAGISGLNSLYGGNTNELLSALGLGNQATNTSINAGKSGWFQNLLGYMDAAGNAGKAAAAMG